MFPLLPFAAGLIAGGFAVRLLRDEKTRTGLTKAQDALYSAAQSSLATIKTTAADVKQHFSPAPAEAAKPAAKKKAAPRTRKTAASTAKTAAPKASPTARKKRAPRKSASEAGA